MALEMKFGRDPLLSQKYDIEKNVGKNYQSDFESTWYERRKI